MSYLDIISHYEQCLDQYGDSHLGVDWPNNEDALRRYSIMLDVIKTTEDTVSLLDFGCGTARLYDYLLSNSITHIDYSGLDISEKFVNFSKDKYPDINFYCFDILKDDMGKLPKFDYVVLNGVFTEKRNLTFEEMWSYSKKVISKVFELTTIGMAFNVMSSHVDWKRDDLFHLPMDLLAEFLTNEISRDFIYRNDYQLYEYTTYIYRR